MIANEYILGDVLGSGGMGIVYRATQPRLGRTVAVKMLRPELRDDATIVKRFGNEALAASRLSHPNVIGIIDFGKTEDGAQYLVMDHVRGRRLSQILDDELPLARVARLFGQVLAALAEAHAAGVIHADVKSDNFLVETLRDGSELVTLIDFGLARFTNTPEATAYSPMVAGTPEYLAPEVIRGVPPSFASDIYGAGIILYELITGSTPFAGGTCDQILARHNAEAVVPPSARCVGREIPPALERVVLRALEKLPLNRFPTATTFAEALTAAAATLDREPAREPRGGRTLASGTGATAALGTLPALRRAIAEAVLGDDVDAIAAAYLETARYLVDHHQLQAAADELEAGIARLVVVDSTARTGPLWRLTLALAGLYDGLGNRVRARSAAFAALGHAASAGSNVGEDRARGLIRRLTPRSGAAIATSRD